MCQFSDFWYQFISWLTSSSRYSTMYSKLPPIVRHPTYSPQSPESHVPVPSRALVFARIKSITDESIHPNRITNRCFNVAACLVWKHTIIMPLGGVFRLLAFGFGPFSSLARLKSRAMLLDPHRKDGWSLRPILRRNS